MLTSESGSRSMTRRQALELLGMSAAAAALPAYASAQAPTFPKGAIIRTILKDYAPEELAGGATLFHEHMQLAPDFNAKFARGHGRRSGREWFACRRARAAVRRRRRRADARAAAARAAARHPMHNVDLMSEEVADAKREGVACIVDAGHPDMGRDINFLRQVVDEVRRPDRRRRRILLAAVLSERDLHDERRTDRQGAHQAGGRRHSRRVRRNRLVGRDHRG